MATTPPACSAATSTSAKRLGGHGWPTRSTGHVGPALITPATTPVRTTGSVDEPADGAASVPHDAITTAKGPARMIEMIAPTHLGARAGTSILACRVTVSISMQSGSEVRPRTPRCECSSKIDFGATKGRALRCAGSDSRPRHASGRAGRSEDPSSAPVRGLRTANSHPSAARSRLPTPRKQPVT